MARCDCGAVLPGHDCPHCPPTKEWKCPKCGKVSIIINEAKRREYEEFINTRIYASHTGILRFPEENKTK